MDNFEIILDGEEKIASSAGGYNTAGRFEMGYVLRTPEGRISVLCRKGYYDDIIPIISPAALRVIGQIVMGVPFEALSGTHEEGRRGGSWWYHDRFIPTL